MADIETIDDITINYEEDGLLKVKELKKEVLTKGAWSTIVFLFQEWNATKEEYGPEKATIRRYRKMNGNYRQQSKFNISNGKQAHQLCAVFKDWFPEEEA